MEIALRIALHFAVVGGVIVVHELGHFVAGLAAGVPANRMRIVLYRYPFHVALSSGGSWCSPMHGRAYAEAAQNLMSGTGALLLFAAGGMVLQTIGMAIGALVLRAVGAAGLGWFAVALSSGMILFYLLIEAAGLLIRAVPPGDIRGMVAISRLGGVAVVATVVAVHAVMLVLW